jgi:hypothetical protein
LAQLQILLQADNVDSAGGKVFLVIYFQMPVAKEH